MYGVVFHGTRYGLIKILYITYYSSIAIRYGVVFHGTRDGLMEITFKSVMKRFKLLHSLEFDPTRKRMSVIVENKDGMYGF